MSSRSRQVEVLGPIDRLGRLERLSNLLDSSISIGNSGYKIGIDPILGLIPGIGDAIGALLSGFIILEAARLGVSRFILLRMLGNVTLDLLIGGVPILGDLFDFAFKANARNLRLLKSVPLLVPKEGGERRLVTTVVFTIVLLLILITAAIYFSVTTAIDLITRS